MSEGPRSQGEVPGWVILHPNAIPEAWRARAIAMALVPLTPTEARQLLGDVPVASTITTRDLPLVRLLARGRTVPEIARELGKSTRTVYRHVTRLRDEFGLSSMEQLATELARRGF